MNVSAKFRILLLTGSRPAKNPNCSFGGWAASKFLNFVFNGQLPSKNSKYSFGGYTARKISFFEKGRLTGKNIISGRSRMGTFILTISSRTERLLKF